MAAFDHEVGQSSKRVGFFLENIKVFRGLRRQHQGLFPSPFPTQQRNVVALPCSTSLWRLPNSSVVPEYQQRLEFERPIRSCAYARTRDGFGRGLAEMAPASAPKQINDPFSFFAASDFRDVDINSPAIKSSI